MIQKFIKRVQEFGRTQIIPHRKQWNKVQALPIQFFKQLGKLGIMGCLVPKKYGGLGSNYAQYATAIEEFAKLEPAVALSLIAHNSLFLEHILGYGNTMQQRTWLLRLASGKCVGSWAFTEPEAGSDVCNLTTIARKIDGGGVSRGKKHSIINGLTSNLVIVMATTQLGYHKENMSAFAVEKENPGIPVGRKGDSDAKLCTIGEGTSEIQRNIIAKALQRENAREDPCLKAAPYV